MAMQNSLLEATEQQIESQLQPDVREAYMKIVVAGMKLGAHNGPSGLLSGLKRQQDPVGACAIGAVNLVLLMSKQSKGVMPMKAMWPAALTLMLQALDLADKVGIVKIDADAIGRATHIFANHFFRALGITPQMLQNGASHVHQIVQDPTKMELINRKVGLVKAPGASEPTMLPTAGQPT